MKKKGRRTGAQNLERKPVKAQKLEFEATYKNYEKLARFMNDRAKIHGRKRSGLSARDQKKVTEAIKHARHLGLLPFASRV